MGLGDKAAALALSERGIAVLPIEKDVVSGAGPIETLARVAAQMGEPDRAIAALQQVLSIPGTAHWTNTCRSLLRCSGSIRCSIRSGMIRASKNSSLRPRRGDPASFVVRQWETHIGYRVQVGLERPIRKSRIQLLTSFVA